MAWFAESHRRRACSQQMFLIPSGFKGQRPNGYTKQLQNYCNKYKSLIRTARWCIMILRLESSGQTLGVRITSDGNDQANKAIYLWTKLGLENKEWHRSNYFEMQWSSVCDKYCYQKWLTLLLPPTSQNSNAMRYWSQPSIRIYHLWVSSEFSRA